MKGISALLLAAAALSGCARLADTAQNLFVSSTPAIALVGPHLVQGQLQVYSDKTGYMALEGDLLSPSVLHCSGRLPSTGSFFRQIDLRCSNGVQVPLAMSLRTDLRGFAYGGEGEQATSLAFGLEPSEVAALLKLPAQTRLVLQDGRYQLARAEGGEAVSAAPTLPPVEAAGKAP